MVGWRVASPSEYLVITGAYIKDIKLAKKAWIWPAQKCVPLSISPVNYSFKVDAMSEGYHPYSLPVVFTIGPNLDDQRLLLRYAKLFSGEDKKSVQQLIEGVIHGEMRAAVASMTMETVFKAGKEFKDAVCERLQLELEKFGLDIYNVNVKLHARETKYFRQKIEMESNSKVQEAKLNMYRKQIASDAAFYATQHAADGELYKKKKEAEALKAMAEAHAFYLKKLEGISCS